MNIISSEILSLLNLLLPGFITSFLLYSLTSFPKKSEFESIIIALIMTFIINVFISIIRSILLFLGQYISFGIWNTECEAFFSLLFAVFFGLFFSYMLNNDSFHKYLRDKGITKQTSYPTEWYGVFSENITFLTLHLKDGRRIMGWPEEWPSSPTNGHFVLQCADWLLEEEGKTIALPIDNVSKILIDANNVEMVEFSKPKEEEEHDESERATTNPKTNQRRKK